MSRSTSRLYRAATAPKNRYAKLVVVLSPTEAPSRKPSYLYPVRNENMKRIQDLVLLICLLGLAACATPRKNPQLVYSGSTLLFQSKDVVGWRYDLLSQERTFSIRFTEGGYAPVTIGSGNVLAAPAYQWKIDDNDCLTISDDEGQIAAYQLLSLSKGTVTVWDKVDGQVKVFTRKPKSEGEQDSP